MILGPFAEQRLPQFSPAQLDAFEHLIDQPDHDLYGWIIGQTEAPVEFHGEVLELLRDFQRSLYAVRGDDIGA